MNTKLMHPLTGQPIVPLGYRRNGAPIWPILGASEPPAQPEPTQAPEPEPEPEPGKTFTQAELDKIVADRVKRVERSKQADYDDLRKKASQLDKLEEASKSDLEKAVAAARKEAEDTVRGEVRTERVLDRIEVLAAKDFADPEDAKLRLGRQVTELVDADGQPDVDAIKKALADLLKARPHLAAAQPDGRPRGNADIGPRQTSEKGPANLSEAVSAHYARSK